MSETVERVARAIFGSEYLEDFPSGGIQYGLEIQKAKAAIEAMSHPREALKEIDRLALIIDSAVRYSEGAGHPNAVSVSLALNMVRTALSEVEP